MKHWFFLFIGVLGACTQPNCDQLFEQAQTVRRGGDREAALELVHKGLEKCAGQKEKYWNFRLLELNCLPSNEARSLLEEFKQMPPVPSLQGRLAFYKSRFIVADGADEQTVGKKRALLESGHALATKAEDLNLLSEIELEMARRIVTEVEAEKWFTDAVNHARQAGDSYQETLARIYQGNYYIKRDNWSKCAETLEGGGEDYAASLKPFYLINLGTSLNRLGRLEEAAQLLGEAIGLASVLNNAYLHTNALGELGNNHFFQHEYAKGGGYYEEAYHVAENAELHTSAFLWSLNMSYYQIEQKQWSAAREWYDKAKKHDLLINHGGPHDEPHLLLAEAIIADGLGNHVQARNLLREIIEKNEYEEEVMWEAHASLGSLLSKQGKLESAQEHYNLAIALIEKATISEAPENAIVYFSRLIKFYQDYVMLLVQQAQHQQAFNVAASSRARLLRLGLPGNEPDYNAVSRSCQGGEATYLSYWIAPERSFLWVFRPDGEHDFIELPPKEEILARLTQYEAFLANFNDAMLGQPNPAGHWLYQELIKPAKIRTGTRVIVETDGELARLNLETLPVYGESSHYWLEDVVLSITPSLAVLEANKKEKVSDSVLVIGDPEMVDPDFPKLVGVKEEILFAREAFAALNPHVLTGEKATPEAYLGLGKPYSLILFAAHGAPNRLSPLDSAIVLSQSKSGGYRLTVREIMSHPTPSETVIVTSCRSAGSTTNGEGLVGFSWAFLHAGAHNVVAGLWNLDDDATKSLMKPFYTDLAGGEDPAVALCAAKLEMVKNGMREPYFWGPIQLYSRNDGN